MSHQNSQVLDVEITTPNLDTQVTNTRYFT